MLEETWRCGRCSPNLLFPDRARLKSHVQSLHEPEEAKLAQSLARCQYCQTSYLREEELRAHSSLHYRPNGQCPACPGVYTNLIVPPASPDGSSLIRCSLSAAHSDEQVDAIIAAVGVATSGQNAA